MENRTYRMYGLVPYNISPIQQGIQFGHAVVEYQMEHGKSNIYHKWAKEDKTFIILNGGTTNNNPESLGSLNQHLESLINNGIEVSTFTEPDLGDQLTAIVFLVDDRVWDKENYPDYDENEWSSHEEWRMNFSKYTKESYQIIYLRQFLRQFRFA